MNNLFKDNETVLNAENLNRLLSEAMRLDNTSEGISGTVQKFTVPITGKFRISAAGASGSLGSGARYYGVNPGKGATLKADYNLTKGDELTILVGQKGTDVSNPDSVCSDYSSGGGGGATFVFKKISAITDSKYQFTKNGENFEVLMVVAGGAGTGDASFSSTYQTIGGMPGGAAGNNCKTPVNYAQWTTNTWTSGSNSANNGGSVIHYRDNNAVGGTYTRSSVKGLGGYGGGGSADNYRPAGGGWTATANVTSGVCSTSWSTGEIINGVDGNNSGHGYCEILFFQPKTDGNGDMYLSDNGTYRNAGSGRGVSSTDIRYQISASGTLTPTGTWLTTIPTVVKGQFLWTRTVLNYNDSTTSTSYSVAYQGLDGNIGATGVKGDIGTQGFSTFSTTSAISNISSISGMRIGDSVINGGTSTLTILGQSTPIGSIVKSTSNTTGTITGNIRGATGATGATGAQGPMGGSHYYVDYSANANFLSGSGYSRFSVWVMARSPGTFSFSFGAGILSNVYKVHVIGSGDYNNWVFTAFTATGSQTVHISTSEMRVSVASRAFFSPNVAF